LPIYLLNVHHGRQEEEETRKQKIFIEISSSFIEIFSGRQQTRRDERRERVSEVILGLSRLPNSTELPRFLRSSTPFQHPLHPPARPSHGTPDGCPAMLLNTGGKHLTSRFTNKEALSLYREILRTSRHFHHCNDKGQPWNVILRQSARKEFEQSVDERDPLIIARLLVTGREAVQQVQRKFADGDLALKNRILRDTNRK
jgi:hypothetical protein